MARLSMSAQAPLLLFGMPRSGTTWLGKIFDSHPRVLYRHEPDTWQRLTDVPIVAGRDAREIHEARLRALPFAVRCKDCEEARETAERRERMQAQKRGSSALFYDMQN